MLVFPMLVFPMFVGLSPNATFSGNVGTRAILRWPEGAFARKPRVRAARGEGSHGIVLSGKIFGFFTVSY